MFCGHGHFVLEAVAGVAAAERHGGDAWAADHGFDGCIMELE
jgi:hypothetical protein